MGSVTFKLVYPPVVYAGRIIRSAPKRAAPRLVIRLTPIAKTVVEKTRLTTTATAIVTATLRISDALRLRRTSAGVRVVLVHPRSYRFVTYQEFSANPQCHYTRRMPTRDT